MQDNHNNKSSSSSILTFKKKKQKKKSKQHKLKTDNYTITQMTIKQRKETWKENTE